MNFNLPHQQGRAPPSSGVILPGGGRNTHNANRFQMQPPRMNQNMNQNTLNQIHHNHAAYHRGVYVEGHHQTYQGGHSQQNQNFQYGGAQGNNGPGNNGAQGAHPNNNISQSHGQQLFAPPADVIIPAQGHQGHQGHHASSLLHQGLDNLDSNDESTNINQTAPGIIGMNMVHGNVGNVANAHVANAHFDAQGRAYDPYGENTGNSPDNNGSPNKKTNWDFRNAAAAADARDPHGDPRGLIPGHGHIVAGKVNR
jgi:hypothetical protein